jgi:hypothetical protein
MESPGRYSIYFINYGFILVNLYTALYLTWAVSFALDGGVAGAFPPFVAIR